MNLKGRKFNIQLEERERDNIAKCRILKKNHPDAQKETC